MTQISARPFVSNHIEIDYPNMIISIASWVNTPWPISIEIHDKLGEFDNSQAYYYTGDNSQLLTHWIEKLSSDYPVGYKLAISVGLIELIASRRVKH